MVAPLVIPSNLQWVGMAKETTYGTPVAAPTVWVPVDGSSVKYKPNLNKLTDQALRGLMSADYQEVAGMRYDTLAYKAYLYLDSVYQHFLSILGKADTVSGTVDPYLHKTSLYNGSGADQAQPISFTMFWIDGLNAWQIPGCQLSDLKLTVKVDELATIEATWMGLAATKLGAVPTNTPTTLKPIPSWNSTISLGGSPLSDFSSIDLTYKRDAAHVPTINASQSPLEIFSGAFSVAGNLTAVYQGGSDVRLTDFEANTQAPLVVKCSPAGDATHYLQATSSLITFDGVDPAGSNKWMEIQASFKALANATDALDSKQSPCQVVLANSSVTAF